MGIFDTFEDFSLGTQSDYRAEGQAVGRAGVEGADQLRRIGTAPVDRLRAINESMNEHVRPDEEFINEDGTVTEEWVYQTGTQPAGGAASDAWEAIDLGGAAGRAAPDIPDLPSGNDVRLLGYLVGALVAVVALGQLFDVNVGGGA